MIEIIPAIDLIDGKCVRLNQGDFTQKQIYDSNPVDTAKRFADAGLSRLHLVDLDGALIGRPQHLNVLQQIANQTELQIDFSGGLKTDADAIAALRAGADLLSIGSIAVNEPAKLMEWISRFGAGRILLGADTLNGRIAIGGWKEVTETSISDFLSYWHAEGIQQAFCTSISRDGMMLGPDVELYQQISKQFPGLNLIASGGVGSLSDIALLKQSGCSAVIVGKAFYNGAIGLADLAQTFSYDSQ